MVRAVTPISASASLTSMSLYGWITASIFFIGVGSPSRDLCYLPSRAGLPPRQRSERRLDALLALQREIQRQHIHTRLAEKAELPALGVAPDEVADDGRIELAR